MHALWGKFSDCGSGRRRSDSQQIRRHDNQRQRKHKKHTHKRIILKSANVLPFAGGQYTVPCDKPEKQARRHTRVSA